MTGNPISIAGAPAARRRTAKPRGGGLRLRRHVPLREGLLSAFSGILLVARRHATAASVDPKRAVHDFRKSIRRARSVVALLRPALGRTAAEGLAEELRQAFRDTGDLRDSDVLTATLAAVSGDDPELFVEAAEVAARLGANPKSADSGKIVRKALPILRRLPAALEVILPREYSTPDLEGGLTRSYRRSHRAWIQARDSRTDADFHEWRKRAKELRYQVELLASTGSPSLKAREKALGALARELGEVTDMSMLCRQIETLAAEGGSGIASRLLARGRALVRERSDALLSRGGEFFSEPPRAFALKVLAERG